MEGHPLAKVGADSFQVASENLQSGTTWRQADSSQTPEVTGKIPAKSLAVRQVTQDNQGKKTAGVDGVKSLTPKQRTELVGQIEISNKAKPTRRVWIPKPGRDEKRPLGIPTMYDRATQGLLKIAQLS